jgi:hypothetical protein
VEKARKNSDGRSFCASPLEKTRGSDKKKERRQLISSAHCLRKFIKTHTQTLVQTAPKGFAPLIGTVARWWHNLFSVCLACLFFYKKDSSRRKQATQQQQGKVDDSMM